MQISTKWFRHRFGGGWATDFGPMSDRMPGADGSLVIPFLTTAENIIYELNGGLHKMPGTSKLNSTVMESGAAVMGLYDFWRQGTTGSPIQKRICHVGTKIKADNGDGVFGDIGTGFVSGAVPNYSTFDDLAIIASDASGDVPKSWDQSTFQSLAGSPPRFSFSVAHKNRQWAAGVYSTPSRLYYSVNLNPEDWTGATSGSIDVDPDDGDMITGLASFRNELWVFKGPYKGSIHRITGSSVSDFARTTFIKGLGANWQTGIFQLPNDLGFISPRGTVHSVVATDRFGDYLNSALSLPINRTLQSDLSHTFHRKWWAATDFDSGYSVMAITPSGQTTNTKQLMMDYRFMALGEGAPRWALWNKFAMASLAPVIDTGNRLRLFAGGYDGYIYKLDQVDRSHNGGAIAMNVVTPFLSYGGEEMVKTIYAVAIELAPKSAQSVTFKWLRDGQTEQTATVTQGGSDVLGPWTSNEFTLDTSTLGGTRYLPRYIELEEGGEFRSIRYTINEAITASDCEVHGIMANIAAGGISTENT